MFKKLQNILLIDDSESDNFIHVKKIRQADVTDEIVVTYSAQEALDYLNVHSVDKNHVFLPNLIFLDINMPGMDGWEFLEEYEKLEPNLKEKIVTIMLTTSFSDNDSLIASRNNNIKAYESKPLTVAKLWKILETYFPERFYDFENLQQS